jgi:drug/metabolite transporter (DMT)-like permease
VGSAILFGASTPAAKHLLPGTSPWLTAGLLYFGSGVGLILLSLFAHILKRPISQDDKLSKADAPWIAAATMFGGVFAPALLLLGLSCTPASTASLLLNMESVFTTLFAWFVFKENFDKRIAIGTVFIFSGSIVLSGTESFALSSLTGPALIAAACLCWALDNNFTRKIAGHHPVQLVIIKSTIAGSTNIALSLATGAILPTLTQIGRISLVGFLGYGISLVLFIFALRFIGTARTGAYFSLAPFAGGLISIVALGEPITTTFMAAASLMTIGVWLHITENHGHEHDHSPLEHSHSHTHDIHHEHDHAPEDEPTLNNSHSHRHSHKQMRHCHPHFPDTHHQHSH